MTLSRLPRRRALRRSRIVAHHRYSGPSAKVRRIVAWRSGGTCEFPGCAAVAVHLHHRKPRRMGGSKDPHINGAANLLHLCQSDHEWIESRRDEAYEMGWLLRDGEVPAAEPVQLDGGSWLLDDLGGMTPYPQED